MEQQAERVVPDWKEKSLGIVWSFTIMVLAVLDIRLHGRSNDSILLYLTDCILGAWRKKPLICCRQVLVYKHERRSHLAYMFVPYFQLNFS